MNNKGKFSAISGGLSEKKPDIVRIKVVLPLGGGPGHVAFVGDCDLGTFEECNNALHDQGFIDLIDVEGTKIRVTKGDSWIVTVDQGVVQRRSSIITPGAH